MEDTQFITGIDEAGLGPLLGPFCTASAQISTPQGKSLGDALASLSNVRINPQAPVPIEDSKKLYTAAKGIRSLEESILAICLYCSGRIPRSVEEYLTLFLINRVPYEELRTLPWYRQAPHISLPLKARSEDIEKKANLLAQELAVKNVDIKKISLNIASEKKFNQLLDYWKNKALACRHILAPLLTEATESPDNRIIIDQQGGRRYYGAWLVDLFPGKFIQIAHEIPKESLYHLNHCEIVFKPHADEESMETAMASMAAKYAREILMETFNRYWSGRCPGIKKTAGYTVDGRRFLQDLAKNGIEPYIIESLQRNK